MAVPFTIGIEEEYQMVDRQTGQLSPRIHSILEKGYSIFGEQVKAEMLQSTVEINSDIMPDIPTAREEMRTMRALLSSRQTASTMGKGSGGIFVLIHFLALLNSVSSICQRQLTTR